MIHTVNGPVKPKGIGFTLMHEHLLCAPTKNIVTKDEDLELNSTEKAIQELKLFKIAGGDCLVEGSTIDYGRKAEILKYISKESKIKIICTTGFLKNIYYPNWVYSAQKEELAKIFVKEIECGIEGSKVKAGILKCGSSYNYISNEEKKVTQAVAIAHLKTGAPIFIHTEIGTMALEQLDILEDKGVNLNKVYIGHLDRNPDFWYHKKIADRGAYVGYDGIGKIKYFPDSTRVDLMLKMINSGYLNNLLVSLDFGRKSYFKSYNGGPGLDYMLKKFIPRLIEQGISKEQIKNIWVKNPIRLLAF